MKTIESTFADIKYFTWVHLVFALLTSLLLLFLLSCTEDPTVKKGDLGPEATIDQVNKALDTAMEGRFPTETLVGDQALYEINQRVETSDVIKMKDILLDVKSRNEDNNFIVYLVDEISVTYDGDKTDSVRKELEWRIAKPDLPELPPAKSTQVLSSLRETLAALSDAFFPKYYLASQDQLLAKSPPVTFHNLKIESGLRPVPPGVAADTNCRGLSPCELQVVEVNFDLVEWPKPDVWKTSQYRYIYSTNTPYPAHLVLLCLKTLVDGGSRDYLVSQCQVLRDFVAGQSE